MNVLNPPKFVTRSLIGVVGLSAIAFFGVAESAKAVNIIKGTDYLYTPANGLTWVDLPTFGKVYLKGVPTFAGGTDTTVARLNDCIFAPAYPTLPSSCSTDIQITGLELISFDFDGTKPGIDGKIRGTLDGQQAIGLMTIQHLKLDNNTPPFFTGTDHYEGTFHSELPVSWQAIDTTTNTVLSQQTTVFSADGQWSHEPLPGTPLVRGAVGDQKANCHDTIGLGCNPQDFFISPTLHTAPNENHDVVPEPLTILGSATAMGFGTFFKRKLGKKGQQDKA